MSFHRRLALPANQKHLERPSAPDIFEQVSNSARQELGRSSVSLAISALAGGIFMGLSALGGRVGIVTLLEYGQVIMGGDAEAEAIPPAEKEEAESRDGAKAA